MKYLIMNYEGELLSIVTNYKNSWFQSQSTAVNKMQVVTQKYKILADALVEEYKESTPSEVNRFILETAELQFNYVSDISNYYASQAVEAMKLCWDKEMKYMLVKTKVLEEIENKVEIEVNQIMKEVVNAKENGDEIDMKSLYNEILALREEVQELKNQIK